jgi:hypothetical protein
VMIVGAPPIDDEAVLRERAARGELVRLNALGSTPLRPRVVEELRALVAERERKTSRSSRLPGKGSRP